MSFNESVIISIIQETWQLIFLTKLYAKNTMRVHHFVQPYSTVLINPNLLTSEIA